MPTEKAAPATAPANYFQRFYNLDFTGKIDKKNGLSYVAWANAWAELKKVYPKSFYTIYERPDGSGINYFTDGKTCWVKTGVTVVFDDGSVLEHIEDLPVMDTRNRSIPLDAVTSMDINKAVQRSLTKAAARHGVGLYVYAGEDLPEELAAENDAQAAVEAEALNVARSAVRELGNELMGAGLAKTALFETVAKFNNGVSNPNSIKDVATCQQVMDALRNIKPTKPTKKTQPERGPAE